MICPLPFHRHTVDVIRATLLDSPDFETHIVPVTICHQELLPAASLEASIRVLGVCSTGALMALQRDRGGP